MAQIKPKKKKGSLKKKNESEEQLEQGREIEGLSSSRLTYYSIMTSVTQHYCRENLVSMMKRMTSSSLLDQLFKHNERDPVCVTELKVHSTHYFWFVSCIYHFRII